ncbi:hypothetical protein SAMN04488025_11640 [Planifilum fulgidum]|jgi:hypothetical protein|uniref:Uncharacterized protein n=1 Tax=Planifilum fulgidum TaxID=201973 RepID=A0A1I2P703_9BACL|nr:hypothetical protein SAMN04488025_11640 [Planifilum fulgidum]
MGEQNVQTGRNVRDVHILIQREVRRVEMQVMNATDVAGTGESSLTESCAGISRH